MPESQIMATLIPLSLLVVLFVATTTDLISHRIPNLLLIPALAIALIFGSTAGGMSGFLNCILGLAVGLILLLPFYAAGGMGAGDVKLLGVAGAFLGPEGALIAGLATFIAGAILGVLWIFWRHLQGALQNYFADLTSPPGMPVQTNHIHRASTFAYAPAISAGTAIALWEQGWLVPLIAT